MRCNDCDYVLCFHDMPNPKKMNPYSCMRLFELKKTMLKNKSFSLLTSWDMEDEFEIIHQIKHWCQRTSKSFDFIKCHFESDLMIIHHPNFSEMELCWMLNIPYEKHFGANTMMCEDMVLNVSKVKEQLR